MTAYVIVQAESHDAAARLFENHPHFMIFPGDSVEIMECLPLRRGDHRPVQAVGPGRRVPEVRRMPRPGTTRNPSQRFQVRAYARHE